MSNAQVKPATKKPSYLTTHVSAWLVFPVAGAAYGTRGQLLQDVSLTHAYNPETEQVLCGKVKDANILDDYALLEPGAPPTCVCCAARLTKLQAKA